MKKTYYLFNDGRMSRKDNTLCFIPRNKERQELPAKYLPIETIESMFVFGALDVNSALLNYLGQKHISLHFFDYYEHYTGSFMPKDYLLAGKMQIEQTKTFLNQKRRMHIAHQFIEGAANNMLRTLRYYQNRDRDLIDSISAIEQLLVEKTQQKDIAGVMGIEGNIRQYYYSAFDDIITDFNMEGRSRQPPSNEINALISFGNMICYTLTLDMIYIHN